MADSQLLWIAVAAAVAFLLAFTLLSLGKKRPAEASLREGSGGGGAAPSERAPKAAAPAASKPAAKPAPAPLPKFSDTEAEEIDVTLVTLSPAARGAGMPGDDDENRPHEVKVFYDDEEAAIDEPTRPVALILVSAAGQSDVGKRRKQNEDSYLVLDDHNLYAVADGMGGYAGGAVASQMTVESLCTAFRSGSFKGQLDTQLPKRAGELAMALQMANEAVHSVASSEAALSQMGTTVVAARFYLNKQRVYIGHVGDSRCYRLRSASLRQLTTDHTLGAQGLKGPLANRLSRALGIGPTVTIDLIVDKPRSDDIYLLCSDGLTKMLSDAEIQNVLNESTDLQKKVDKFISTANERGGKDNITVLLVKVMTSGGKA